MAIQKTLTDSKGQATEYHRIIAFAPVFVEGQEILNINIASYTSKQYRDMEKAGTAKDMQVASTGITLPIREDDTYTRENIYADIMALPEWEGSTEV